MLLSYIVRIVMVILVRPCNANTVKYQYAKKYMSVEVYKTLKQMQQNIALFPIGMYLLLHKIQ